MQDKGLVFSLEIGGISGHNQQSYFTVFHGGTLGIGERKRDRKGKVKRDRIYTVYVDTGVRYEPTEKFPEGRKKYKRVVRTLGSVHKVSKTRAQNLFKREQSKYNKDKHGQSPLLSEFASRYINHKRDAEGKKSWERDVYSLNNLIDYYSPDTLLIEIDPESIDRYKVERQKKVTPKTVNNELEALRGLFNLALRWGEYSGENPVSKAGLIKKIIREKRQGPTPDEEAKLLRELAPNTAQIVTFALHTGMRISEIVNLETDQIKETQYFDNGEVITVKLVVLKDTDTKTGQGRVIPLNADAERSLNEALEYNDGRRKRIFLNSKGEPYSSYNAVYLAMKRACKRLKIRLITPHDLRRGFASRMVESGTDLISIRDTMGHVSFKMLESYVTVNASKIRGVKLIETKPADNGKKESSES